jgi:hypothetical protein
MGQPLRPPHRGIPAEGFLGYHLVSPLFISGFAGRVKSLQASAFAFSH